MKVTLVPREYAARQVNSVKHLLKRAADESNGRYDVEDLVEGVTTFEYELWLVYDLAGINCVVLTRPVHYPRKRYLEISFAAGDGYLEALGIIVNTMFRYAVDIECDGIEFRGRPGWAKVLKEAGVKVEGIFASVDIGS